MGVIQDSIQVAACRLLARSVHGSLKQGVRMLAIYLSQTRSAANALTCSQYLVDAHRPGIRPSFSLPGLALQTSLR